MTTFVDPDTRHQLITDAFDRVMIGYDMAVPCIVEECDREVMWWGTQHGCRSGHSCDFHMKRWMEALKLDLKTQGYLHCMVCKRQFELVSDFFRFLAA